MPVPRKLFKLLPAALLAAALVPSAAHAAAPGLNYRDDVGNAARLQNAINTGANEIRLFVDWSSWEPNGPVATLNATDNQRLGYFKAFKQIKDAGRRVLVVVTGAPGWANGGQGNNVPPNDPQTYATFVGKLVKEAAANGSAIDALEVWNEEDGSEFWAPAPNAAAYTALLRASYASIKANSPGTSVYVGPTVGNDYRWIQQLYDNGAKGNFDAVSVHTDTACLTASPDSFFRDAQDGRLSQFTFLGYREVRAQMLANGDDKPIVMSELGWSSTGGAPNSCTRGTFAGQKPSGVTEAQQAEFLTKAYQCLANDPYVIGADWFQFSDESGQSIDEFNHYGLIRGDDSEKPSLNAFRAITAAGGGGPGPCGDFEGPQLSVQSPQPGQQFVDKLDLRASASDSGVGVGRVTFLSDGSLIRNFTGDALSNIALTPWQGSGALGLGPHTISVIAVDNNGNQTQVDVPVQKVDETQLARTLTPEFKLAKKVSCKKRRPPKKKGKKQSKKKVLTCLLTGQLLRGQSGTPSIGGKVSVEWQFRNKKKKFRKLSGGLKPANKKFSFALVPKHKGTWRVRVVYKGMAPWKAATSRYITFKVR